MRGDALHIPIFTIFAVSTINGVCRDKPEQMGDRKMLNIEAVLNVKN